MSMITATAWVPRGVSAPFPTKYEFDEKEFQRISELAKLQLDDANEDLEGARKELDLDSEEEEEHTTDIDSAPAKFLSSKTDQDDDLKEYDLEHYDDDIDDDQGHSGGIGMDMFGNVKTLAYHASNADDPYITMQENEEDEDREELQILATDNLILTAKVEDEVAHLEILVYEDDVNNLYVHHDIMLPAIPLCVEWLDSPVGRNVTQPDSRGSFVAVGTFDPDIEIWDLDTVDSMYPNAILGKGGESSHAEDEKLEQKKKRKKKRKSVKANDNYHVDAVLSLAANSMHRNLLASSSADKTVKLWDLNTSKCAKSYSHHTDKICSVQWHPTESTVLLSGSYDRTVVASDMRAPEAKAPTWGVESDVEAVKWNPHDPNYFFITTEGGMVHYHDLRKVPSSPATSKPVWILQAHNDSISAFDINPKIPGFIATGSTDKQVKLWNIQPSGPSMVVSRDLDIGKVFSTTFAPDEEVCFRLAVAGSKGLVQIWDTSTNPVVRRTFANNVGPDHGGEIKERLVSVKVDSDDESENEGNGGKTSGNLEQGWESMDED